MKTNRFILSAVAMVIIEICFSGEAWPNTPASEGHNKPNIVLIVIDTLRADHLSCYGYKQQTTPCVDKLAQQGFVFERCYSASSWTLPACVSLLTGLYVDTHGAKQWESNVPKRLPFVPEILAKHGYYCAGISSNPFLSRKKGFSRGFDVFDDTTVLAAAEWSFPLAGSQYKAMVLSSTGATTTRRAMELLNDCPKDRPFFLFVHYMDCHADYVPPPPFDRKFDPNYTGNVSGHVQSERFPTDINKRDLQHVISLYDGEVAYTDMQIGQLLDHITTLGLDHNTCIILTADHGEEFLEHGNWSHGHTLFEECTRVPLIFRWPEQIPAARRDNSTVSLVDVMPTLLGILNVKPPDVCQGIDLYSVIKDGSKMKDRTVIMETDLGQSLRAIVHGNLKMVVSLNHSTDDKEGTSHMASSMAFDLFQNPHENINNQIRDPNQREKLTSCYVNVVDKLNDSSKKLVGADADNTSDLDRAQLERLKSLGYIGN